MRGQKEAHVELKINLTADEVRGLLNEHLLEKARTMGLDPDKIERSRIATTFNMTTRTEGDQREPREVKVFMGATLTVELG